MIPIALLTKTAVAEIQMQTWPGASLRAALTVLVDGVHHWLILLCEVDAMSQEVGLRYRQ